MLRWIVSLTALIAVSSVFAQGTLFDKNHHDGNSDNSKNSYCDPTPVKCDPKPPTNCVPEPGSVAVMAIGGLGLLLRKKKKKSA
jgi:hypothetical protein